MIHAGIYYPTGLTKTRLCVEGNAMLYRFCCDHSVPRIGLKLRMSDDPDLLGVRDHDFLDVRRDHRGDRGCVASRLDDDHVLLGELLCESLEKMTAHVDAPQKGRPCNELRLSAHCLSAACPHLRAPGAPCPRWAHHNAVSFRKQADSKAPRITYRITELSSVSTRPCSTSSTGSPSARRSTRRSSSCRPTSI